MQSLETIHDYLRCHSDEIGQRILSSYPSLHGRGESVRECLHSSLSDLRRLGRKGWQRLCPTTAVFCMVARKPNCRISGSIASRTSRGHGTHTAGSAATLVFWTKSGYALSTKRLNERTWNGCVQTSASRTIST